MNLISLLCSTFDLHRSDGSATSREECSFYFTGTMSNEYDQTILIIFKVHFCARNFEQVFYLKVDVVCVCHYCHWFDGSCLLLKSFDKAHFWQIIFPKRQNYVWATIRRSLFEQYRESFFSPFSPKMDFNWHDAKTTARQRVNLRDEKRNNSY